MIANRGRGRMPGASSFGAAINYIVREGPEHERDHAPPLAVWSENVAAIETAAFEMKAVASRSRAAEPLYHLMVSFAEGERPTYEQARAALANNATYTLRSVDRLVTERVLDPDQPAFSTGSAEPPRMPIKQKHRQRNEPSKSGLRVFPHCETTEQSERNENDLRGRGYEPSLSCKRVAAKVTPTNSEIGIGIFKASPLSRT